QLGGRLRVLGERTVSAAVVAARQRAAVEDGEVQRHAYSPIRFRTACEYSQGPSASERSTPAAVSRRHSASRRARPRGSSSLSWGRSSKASLPKRLRYAANPSPSPDSSDWMV